MVTSCFLYRKLNGKCLPTLWENMREFSFESTKTQNKPSNMTKYMFSNIYTFIFPDYACIYSNNGSALKKTFCNGFDCDPLLFIPFSAFVYTYLSFFKVVTKIQF